MSLRCACIVTLGNRSRTLITVRVESLVTDTARAVGSSRHSCTHQPPLHCAATHVLMLMCIPLQGTRTGTLTGRDHGRQRRPWRRGCCRGAIQWRAPLWRSWARGWGWLASQRRWQVRRL